MSVNARHLRLIGAQTARHAVRGGSGLVFLLLVLAFGLIAAQVILAPVELVTASAAREGVTTGTQEATAKVLESARPVVRWALGGTFTDMHRSDQPPPTVENPYDRWSRYLLEQRPGLLSAIFILLAIGIPLLVPFAGFNQISGDAQSRGLRYLLLRTERGNIFFGRFLGTALFSVFVVALLVAIVTFYVGMRIGIYPAGLLTGWALHGFVALVLLMLPYIALTSAVSASIDSPFLSLVVSNLLIGGVPVFAWIAAGQWKYAGYLKYLLPWSVQTHLLHPDLTHVLGAAAACLGYTIVYLLLGYRYFSVRDLQEDGQGMTPAIQVRGLAKRFGRTRALDGVSFDVPRHSIFGLLGPNGAGKTTLFSIAANFLKADAGTVEVLGVDTRRISQLQGRFTILPQDAHFQRNVPILQQLAFFRRLDGQPQPVAEREVLETLGRVGLESAAKRRVHTLSHGMIQRLGVAQAFLGRPEVILLDEPTSGLDPANARQVRDLVKTLQQQTTVVVSSHNLAEIQELCDHVAILDRGKLVLAAPVDEITRAGREYIVTLARPLTQAELSQLAALPGVKGLAPAMLAGDGSAPAGAAPAPAGPTGYVATIDLTDPGLELDSVLSTLLRAILDRGVAVRKLTEGRSLETHFLAVTGRETDSHP